MSDDPDLPLTLWLKEIEDRSRRNVIGGSCNHVACPITDGELWAPGKCMLDGCPRVATRIEAADR